MFAHRNNGRKFKEDKHITDCFPGLMLQNNPSCQVTQEWKYGFHRCGILEKPQLRFHPLKINLFPLWEQGNAQQIVYFNFSAGLT